MLHCSMDEIIKYLKEEYQTRENRMVENERQWHRRQGYLDALNDIIDKIESMVMHDPIKISVECIQKGATLQHDTITQSIADSQTFS